MHSNGIRTSVGIQSISARFHKTSCAVIVGLASLLVACSSDRPLEMTSAAPYHAPKTGVVHSAAVTKHTGAKIASTETARYVVRLKTDTRTVAYGRGPYICSPSGFGQTSRCVPRSKV